VLDAVQVFVHTAARIYGIQLDVASGAAGHKDSRSEKAMQVQQQDEAQNQVSGEMNK